jgi:hypothetical protein
MRETLVSQTEISQTGVSKMDVYLTRISQMLISLTEFSETSINLTEFDLKNVFRICVDLMMLRSNLNHIEEGQIVVDLSDILLYYEDLIDKL